MIKSSRQLYTFQLLPTRTSGDYIWGVGRGGTKLLTIFGAWAYMTTAGSSAAAGVGLNIDGVIFSPNVTITTGNSTGLKTASNLTVPVSASGMIFGLQQIGATDTTGVGTLILDLDISF